MVLISVSLIASGFETTVFHPHPPEGEEEEELNHQICDSCIAIISLCIANESEFNSLLLFRIIVINFN